MKGILRVHACLIMMSHISIDTFVHKNHIVLYLLTFPEVVEFHTLHQYNYISIVFS